MRRIPALWSKIEGSGVRALIPFVTAGFPNQEATLDAVRAAVDTGVDMIELGVPFSDPVADGPAIQHSSQVALDRGTDLHSVLRIAERARRYCELPLVLMGYYNPFLKYGLNRFSRDAVSAGVDGLIIPDLPPDEGAEFKRVAEAAGLSMVFLIAPTTTPERVRRVGKAATDFAYCVAVTGVTGARKAVESRTAAYLKRVRKAIGKPIVVGFGVSKPAHVRTLGRYADGVVVGSALVPVLRQAPGSRVGVAVKKALKPLVNAAHRRFMDNGAKN